MQQMWVQSINMLHRKRNRDQQLRWFDDFDLDSTGKQKNTNNKRSISTGNPADYDALDFSLKMDGMDGSHTISQQDYRSSPRLDYCSQARKIYCSKNNKNVLLSTNGLQAFVHNTQRSPLLCRQQQNEQQNQMPFTFAPGQYGNIIAQKRRRMQLRTILRIAAWHIVLYCFVVLYILTGASIFHYLEGEHEIERHLEQSRLIQRHKIVLIERVQRDFHNRDLLEYHLRLFLENISRISTLENYLLFDSAMIDSSNYAENNEDRLNVPKRWTFESSVLFAFTILTTIGYGNVAPTTTVCQVFTMIYGAFGIPLFLITLADVGRFFKTFIMFIVQRASGREFKKHKTERKILREIGEVVLVAVLFLTFIAVGSAVLPLWEHELTYFNSVYFSYMSLTTIGLGDIVPRRMDFLLPTLVYITIGLWLTTAMVEQLADVFRLVHYAGRHVSNVKSIKVWLGGHQVSVGSLIQTICRRVGMSDNISGRINWDRTIGEVLNGEPPPLVPIFPWHFADFLEHDPPLIDEDYCDYENEAGFAAEYTNFGRTNGQNRSTGNGLIVENKNATINKLRLSPPRLNGFLRHTVSVAPPPVAREVTANPSPFLWKNRRNFSAPALEQFMAQNTRQNNTKKQNV